jgi:energy-coupling factor transport system permease protein
VSFLDTPLLRFVPRTSPIHRVDARVKIVVLGALSLVVAWQPTWFVVAGLWCAITAAFLLARLPFGVLPRPPRLFLVGVAMSGALSWYGGDVVVFLRSLALFTGLFLVAAVLAWTTPPDRLAAGLAWLLRPVARIPVIGDATAGLTMAVRGVTLVMDELRLTWVGWRTRNPTVARPTLGQAVDLVATTVVGVTRRARDLDDAIADRG